MNPQVISHVATNADFRSDHLKAEPGPGAACAPARPQKWYALHTRARSEKVVDRLLSDQGFRTFLPLVVKRSRISFRRFREAQLPLFPGYTFARFAACPENFRAVRNTNGVVEIVGRACQPVSIPDEEIESIHTLLANHVSCAPLAGFEVGQPVVITSGPLRGIKGEILRRNNRKVFVIKVAMIQRCVEVGLSGHDLEAVTASNRGAIDALN